MPGTTHPIDIVVEVLNADTELQDMVPEGFHTKDFQPGTYKLRGCVKVSMIRPDGGVNPGLNFGVMEILLAMQYENEPDDHVAKIKAAERIIKVLNGAAFVTPDRSSTGEMEFLGLSEIQSSRMDLPQDMVSVSFQYPVVILRDRTT